MKTKDYIVIKDNKILMSLNTSNGMEGVLKSVKDIEYDEIQEFKGNPLNFGIHKNDDVRHFDEAWKRKPLSILISEKLFTLKDDEEIIDERIVKKVVEEKENKEHSLTEEQLYDIQIQNKIQEILRRQAIEEIEKEKAETLKLRKELKEL